MRRLRTGSRCGDMRGFRRDVVAEPRPGPAFADASSNPAMLRHGQALRQPQARSHTSPLTKGIATPAGITRVRNDSKIEVPDEAGKCDGGLWTAGPHGAAIRQYRGPGNPGPLYW
jgi:hypothetical protein